MKRHQMAVAPSVDEHDAGTAAVESQTHKAPKRRITRPASGEAGFVPASVPAREHTLILTGELDSSSAHALEAEIERLCEERVTSITLDLRELTYIDPVGVAVIVFRCRLCKRRGYEFALVPGGRIIHRAFEQAGVDGLLPFREAQDRPEAEPVQTIEDVRPQREPVVAVRLDEELGRALPRVAALTLSGGAGGGQQ
ncbi:MAG: STAS domain-containing protein [Solirubrobacteraceae bacterium]